MSAWLYDPEKDLRDGKEFEYNSPIDKELNEFLEMRIEDMKENLMLCKANMLKEIRKAG